MTPTPPKPEQVPNVDQHSVDEPKAGTGLADALREIRRGNWRDLETDMSRAMDFDARVARRRSRGLGSTGAESKQGDTMDLQPVAFLAEGASRRRAVGLVEVSLGPNYRTGTGFLVSPKLFLTNFHVLPTREDARAGVVYFDKEVGDYAISTVTTYRLDPDQFYLASPEEGGLDYALVAVGPKVSGPATIEELGFCPLSNSPDRHRIGMNTNIVHHPDGRPKQISIRNNYLLARGQAGKTLWYSTDTETGSSGAPVFNDDWDVVALHHYGHPFAEIQPDQGQMPAFANEGIRISAIYKDLEAACTDGRVSGRAASAVTALLAMANTLTAPRTRLGPLTGPMPKLSAELPPQVAASHNVTNQGEAMSIPTSEATITIPLQVSIRVGTAGLADGVSAAQSARHVGTAGQQVTFAPRAGGEAKRLDRDYSNREGFDETFIPGLPIQLPRLSAKLAQEIAPLRGSEKDPSGGILNYTHFSVVMHRTHKIAIYTATNIDGPTYLAIDRDTGEPNSAEGDTWYKDPRISESFVLGQDFYGATSDYFDRGHLTRRTDPTWGDPEESKRANIDTFHFTNCSPQHFRFNQSAKFWQGAERYVLENGVLDQETQRRIVVFQGPVFDEVNDLYIDETQIIPSQYWKVIVWKGQRGVRAVGLLLSQRELLDEQRRYLGKPTDLKAVEVNQWRVPIRRIQKETGLQFDDKILANDTFNLQDQPHVGEASQAAALRSKEDLKYGL